MYLHRSLHVFISLVLIFSCVIPKWADADPVDFLPAPGTMVNLSSAFEPVLIKGLKVHPNDPFLFDFIVDSGDSGLALDDAAFRDQSNKVIKYFLSALTLPEKDLWVNLSPYEKDRMIAANLGQTQMGQDMLAQDYVLKQLTASMIYPEKGLGKEFWDKVYAQVNADAAASPISMDAFNKVWIVADRADVYEGKNAAFVTSSHLKVMLEEDYLATKTHGALPHVPRNDGITQTLKQIVLPAIEKEVNEGKNFAQLRQMYHSMILASWYKMRLKNAIMAQVYGNKSKINATINADDPKDKEAIFERYVAAYKKGVFNFIKDEVDPKTYQSSPRKYFSGGLNIDAAMVIRLVNASGNDFSAKGDLALVTSPVKLMITGSSRTRDPAQMTTDRQIVQENSREFDLEFEDIEQVVTAIPNRSPNEKKVLYMFKNGNEAYRIRIMRAAFENNFPFIFLRKGNQNAFLYDPDHQRDTPWFFNQSSALERYTKNNPDHAQSAADYGGIDFNSGFINVNKQGNGVLMKVDHAMIDRINAEGFAGVDFRIDRIIPISNLQAILGA